jgi:glutamyl/glutaminyl-tRNA synthetase
MHAGNIFAFLVSWLLTKAQNGEVVLRIEDLDSERSKSLFSTQIQKDLETLGLTWDRGPYFQHDRHEVYASYYHKLEEKGLVYPCFCTRADLHAASAPQSGEKRVYAGTCRNLSETERLKRAQERRPAMRLIVPYKNICIDDEIQGRYCENLETDCGDFVIRRANGDFAYQLAVTIDDAEEHINYIVRGVDLLSSSPEQAYIQSLFEFPSVHYAHVPLLLGPDGHRLSKRHQDASLEEMLGRYKRPEGIIGHLAYLSGLIPENCETSAEELTHYLRYEDILKALKNKLSISWNA